MKIRITKILSGLAALVAVGVTAQAQYTYTALDDPQAGSGANQGTAPGGVDGTNIVGYYIDSGNSFHGFLYNGRAWRTLNAPPASSQAGYGTAAYGISGTNIVGDFYALSGHYGFLFNGSTWTELNDPQASQQPRPDYGTLAHGISGTNIVGHYVDGYGKTHGFLYNGHSWRTLDDPLGAQGTFPRSISGANIVGMYIDSAGHEHGFLYNGSTWTTLDFSTNTTYGSYGTYANGISGGNIVGGYDFNNGYSDTYSGFLYNGTWNGLDSPPSSDFHTYANGISGGDIVGFYIDSSGVGHGFLGVLTSLSSIASIAPGNPTVLTANGDPDNTYVLQRATNLVAPVWINVATNDAALFGGTILMTDHFGDLGGAKPTHAYYRLSWPP